MSQPHFLAKDRYFYRLMKCEMIANDLQVSGFGAVYRQILMSQFHPFSDALAACGAASDTVGSRHYVLNQSGKEYYGSTWID
ncbi:MAG: hypothetical protein ABW124_15305 [Candidatus Thiodiazotropha sp. 6PLUC9]